MNRGSGIGLQIEIYPTTLLNNRYVLSLYQYEETAAERSSSDSEEEREVAEETPTQDPFGDPEPIRQNAMASGSSSQPVASGSGTRS